MLLSARHIVEIATLLFLRSAKREKLYLRRQLIEGLFSPHSSLIADKIVRHDGRGIIENVSTARGRLSLNDDYTSIGSRRGDFQSSLERRRERHCYFFNSLARRSLTSHVDFGAEANAG